MAPESRPLTPDLERAAALRAIDDRRFRALVLAVWVGSAVLLLAYLFRDGWAASGPLAVAATAVWISKMTIFGGAAEAITFSPWTLGFIAWVMDAVVSALILSGFKGLEQLPVVGRVLVQARLQASQALVTYPGLRRLALWGIFAFVFAPLPGSGSVTGTLLAQMIGLSRTASLLAVTGGALTAVLAYAFLAHKLGQHGRELLESPPTIAAILLGMGLFTWLGLRYVKRVLRQG
jgi:uncharacterized membrane protein